MRKITREAQQILIQLDKKDVAVDFTCGNGNDAFYLAHHFRKVYGFDVQPQAIENSKERCRYLSNVEIILDSHEYFSKYVNTFDAGIFNLGYLPGGDDTITTNMDIVLKTLKKALLQLCSNGSIILVLYTGHAYGKEEAVQVEAFCENLNAKDYDVSKTCLLNRKDAPYIVRIDKH